MTIVKNTFRYRDANHTHCLMDGDKTILAGDYEQCLRVKSYIEGAYHA